MPTNDIFESLKSDEVYCQGVIASDVNSLCKFLLRSSDVQKVIKAIDLKPALIADLISFMYTMIAERPDYDDVPHRHNYEIPICAAILILV